MQSSVSFLGISPALTTILVFYAGIRYGGTKGLLLGVLIGALEDSLSLSMLGPNMLAKGIIGYSSSFFISMSIFRWTPLLGLIAISLFTFIDNSIVFLSKSLFDKVPTALSTAVFISIMQSILNAPAGIFIRPEHAD
jgi:rod shape-determining protein MreD